MCIKDQEVYISLLGVVLKNIFVIIAPQPYIIDCSKLLINNRNYLPQKNCELLIIKRVFDNMMHSTCVVVCSTFPLFPAYYACTPASYALH